MKEIVIAIGSAALGGLMALGGTLLNANVKQSEVNVQYLNIALSILREDPSTSQISSVRGWAIDVINESAPVQINSQVREELLKNKLAQSPLQQGAIRLAAGGGLFALPIVYEEMQQVIGNVDDVPIQAPRVKGIISDVE